MTGRSTKSLLLGPLIFDLGICIILGLLFILLPELSIRPYKQGFFCDDESIRLPYKDDTLSPAILAVILIVVAIGTIASVEVYRNIKLSSIDSSTYSLHGLRIHRVLARFFTYLGYCLLGLLFEYVICEATKLSVGRLRPNFMDVCRPNFGMTACIPPYTYITNYTCTSSYSEYLKKEAHVSFFSGHTSTTFHVVSFCVIFLHARLPRRMYGVMLLPIIQVILIVGGLLVGISRISDHKHHWTDVFAGGIVGCITGTLSAVYLARIFSRRGVSYKSSQSLLLVDSETTMCFREEAGSRPHTGSQFSNSRCSATGNGNPAFASRTNATFPNFDEDYARNNQFNMA